MSNPGRKEGNKVTEKIEKGEREPEYPRSAFFYFCREKINENKRTKLSMNELGKIYKSSWIRQKKIYKALWRIKEEIWRRNDFVQEETG